MHFCHFDLFMAVIVSAICPRKAHNRTLLWISLNRALPCRTVSRHGICRADDAMGAQTDGAEGGGPMGNEAQGKDEQRPPRPRPSPTPGARAVNTMTITVTPEQYAALVSLAEAKGVR